jgi:hypothetical protein
MPAKSEHAKPLGWRINEFLQLVPVSRATVYNMINAGELEATKVRGATIILTDPAELLQRNRMGRAL